MILFLANHFHKRISEWIGHRDGPARRTERGAGPRYAELHHLTV